MMTIMAMMVLLFSQDSEARPIQGRMCVEAELKILLEGQAALLESEEFIQKSEECFQDLTEKLKNQKDGRRRFLQEGDPLDELLANNTGASCSLDSCRARDQMKVLDLTKGDLTSIDCLLKNGVNLKEDLFRNDVCNIAVQLLNEGQISLVASSAVTFGTRAASTIGLGLSVVTSLWLSFSR